MVKTKIKDLFTWPRILALVVLLLLVYVSRIDPIFAQTFTQGYGADTVLQKGMIIQIKESDSKKVEPVKPETADKMHGVVVDANDAPVTLSSEGQKVFVANTGRFEVLVTTQNGKVKAGDYITISALQGLGMKATDLEPIVIGRALSDFDGEANVISTAEISNSDGDKKPVAIGRVSADITVSRNPLLRAEEPNLPELLRRASETIAGKEVNAVRVYVGLVIFIISTIIAGVLLYGGVRSAVSSIGRNPLSKKSIIRSMLQVILTGIIIFISGIFGVYLILRL
jgi:hypothetical protein